MSSSPRRPITETSSELTRDIDVAIPLEIVRLLRASDAQIFGGYGGFEGMSDPETHLKLAKLADRAAAILNKPTGRVILSGAGTSGRLAMFTTRTFNRFFGTKSNPEPFRYTIAGTDLALIAAQEGAEDDANQGIADLKAAAAGAEEIFYVGITCGLSAPYIAGQLSHMLNDGVSGHSVLLGFNPLEFARDTPIEGWEGTFLDVANKAMANPNFDLLNPVVGPEPITGSTRMKGGSATKILLETIFHAARAAGEETDTDEGYRMMALNYVVRVLLADYETAIREAYMPTDEIAELMEAGADALNAGARIFYLGNTSHETVSGSCEDHDHGDDDHEHDQGAILRTDAGVLSLIDASECPPTYGASHDDVRGYLEGGWEALLSSGENLSGKGENFRISLDDFKKDKLETLTGRDLVVFLGDFEGRDDLVEQVHGQGAQTAAIVIPQAIEPPATGILVNLTPPLTTISTGGEGTEAELFDGPPQLAIKLILNALTTGAYVLNGKVYGNRMVDLRISNNKLFHRTVGIISDLTGTDEAAATQALLRSVYQVDTLTETQLKAPVSDHIEASKSVPRLVPTALLLATANFNWQQASDTLDADPIVRNAIGSHIR